VKAFFAAAAIVLVITASTQAQPVTHRTAVAAGEATPTNGSFSIRFPVAFNDIELRAEDPSAPTAVVRMLSGINGEGLRFSATETPLPELPLPIDGFMEAARKRPGASISDINLEQKDGIEIQSFSLTDTKGGSYFRRSAQKPRNICWLFNSPKHRASRQPA
jgi:hypothetical protein